MTSFLDVIKSRKFGKLLASGIQSTRTCKEHNQQRLSSPNVQMLFQMILNEHSPSFCGAFESTRMRKCGRIKRFLQAFMFAISSIMVQGSRVSNNFNAAAALKHASLHHLTMGPRLENQCTMHLKLFFMQQFFRTEVYIYIYMELGFLYEITMELLFAQGRQQQVEVWTQGRRKHELFSKH